MRTEEVGVRWRTMLAANSRTAIEFTECWEELQGEAREMATYLGEELEGQLAAPLEGVGEGRLDGSTRHLITQQRESMRAKVLSMALNLHPDQTARPVWVYPQFDKMSCAWLVATPSPQVLPPAVSYLTQWPVHPLQCYIVSDIKELHTLNC